MWFGRILPWLVVPVGVALAAASWSGLSLADDVNRVRSVVGQRVTWMTDIQALQEAAGDTPPPAERIDLAVERLRRDDDALREALRDHPAALEAFETLREGRLGSDAAVASGYPVVRALRRQTRAASIELDGYWGSLNRIVAWSVALSAICMVLLVQVVVVRAREARLWHTLQRYADQRAAIAEAQRGSATARFRRDLQQVIEGLPVGVAVLAGEVVLYANPELARLLKRDSPDDLVGGTLEAAAGLERSDPVGLQWDDAPAELVVLRDGAERRGREARLRLADRLASVGTMASGVAHEINNPLTWIVLDLDELAERLSGTPEATELVEPIQQGVARIQQIVRDLSTFARGEAAPDRPTDDLAALLRSTARMVTSTTPHSVRIEVPAAAGPAVAGPDSRVGQVFLNLLVNAVEATASQPSREDAHVRVTVDPPTSTTVTVVVSDDGPGIPEANLERVFDPFFTTKPVGEGTGLGLFICHQILERLGGRVEVESVPGVGATFRVTLPLASADRTTETPPHAPSRAVLVVDGDPLVGRAIARLIEPTHRAVTASSLAEARAAWTAGKFDRVLCATELPDGAGRDLLGEVGKALVIVLDGPPTDEERAYIERAGLATLDKPVRADQLGEVLESA